MSNVPVLQNDIPQSFQVYTFNYHVMRLLCRDENTEIINERNKILMSNIQNYLNHNIITSSIVNDPFFKKISTENNFTIEPFNVYPIKGIYT